MRLSRRQIYAYLALGAVVVAVGVRYVVLPGAAGSAGGEPLVLAPAPSSATSPAAKGSPGAVADVVVYVCGAVRSPGIIRLPGSDRVADALELAGGATGKAELAAINLAARVVDGQQIVVPERVANASAPAGLSPAGSSAASQGAGAAVPGGQVNINTASLTELDTLQGVGPSTAQKIIDYRTANGGFKTIEDIKNVPGIGDARFAAMRDSISV